MKKKHSSSSSSVSMVLRAALRNPSRVVGVSMNEGIAVAFARADIFM